MHPRVVDECREAMDELCRHPTAKMFQEPVDPERDEAPGYFDIVKTPMDLKTIRQKLDDGQYLTVHQWKEDVLLVFSNAVLYNGKGSPVGVIASELHQVFRSLAKMITDDPDVTWLNQLLQLKRDLMAHIAKYPADVTAVKHSAVVVGTGAEIKRFVVKSMKKTELEKLAKNLRKLKEPAQIQQLEMILKRGNPDISWQDGQDIDLNFLTPSTLRELKEYAMTELERLGLSY